MSDYTDEMLEGEFCEECGCHLGGGNGFPTKCTDCRNSDDFSSKEVQ